MTLNEGIDKLLRLGCVLGLLLVALALFPRAAIDRQQPIPAAIEPTLQERQTAASLRSIAFRLSDMQNDLNYLKSKENEWQSP